MCSCVAECGESLTSELKCKGSNPTQLFILFQNLFERVFQIRLQMLPLSQLVANDDVSQNSEGVYVTSLLVG